MTTLSMKPSSLQRPPSTCVLETVLPPRHDSGAQAANELNLAFRMTALNAREFLRTLEQVELSHVPFPDEPPIRWPPAEVWKALTEQRKKWSSVDLHKFSPSEEKITAALDEMTEIEFIDTPLSDAMDFLSDMHGIQIVLDETAMAEDGISSDEPLTRTLSGVTLRSALRILLQDLALTYVIENEVMLITTEAEAELIMSTRVYPVGDLVIPIQSMMSGGSAFGGLGRRNDGWRK